MKQDEQPSGPPIQDPVQLPSEVAAQLPELTLDLGTMWEGQRRIGVVEVIQAIDLVIDHNLPPDFQPTNKDIDRLATVLGTVVDRLHFRHGGSLPSLINGKLRAATSLLW